MKYLFPAVCGLSDAGAGHGAGARDAGGLDRGQAGDGGRGVLIDCAPLQPAAASTTVRVRDGEALLTDGPAAEIKEVFGGFTLVECADLDDALKWAARLPAARDGRVEVRPALQVPGS
jgi:hypothetical protein